MVRVRVCAPGTENVGSPESNSGLATLVTSGPDGARWPVANVLATFTRVAVYAAVERSTVAGATTAAPAASETARVRTAWRRNPGRCERPAGCTPATRPAK